MDISECTRIVFDKLQRFEPEHATKIIGYLLMQDHGEQEIAKLASFPDHLVHEVALLARNELQKLATNSSNVLPVLLNPQQDLSQRSVISSGNPSPTSFQVQSPYFNLQSAADGNTNAEFMTVGYFDDSIIENQKHNAFFGSENHHYHHVDSVNSPTANFADDYYYNLDYSTAVGNLNGKIGKRFSNMSEFPFKTCHYFSKGYCRHGNSCRFYHHHHGHVAPEIFSQVYENDAAANDEQAISPGSLAQLESEIVELLKQRGNPISIASLPMAYYDKYKKVLQAEGYLAESQRHGKSGYNLTRLLIRLRNSIRLIDRPHGQHAVVLAEDAPKFMGKTDCQNISASQQIYLTFPADSTFSEEDVSNYFSSFGSVEDVRIPCQQRRMFGFVTFVEPETVKMILDKGNPHYVRGSRVLVKPYKEKPKLIDRKYPFRVEHPVCYSPRYADIDAEITSPRNCGNRRHMRRLLLEDQNRFLEFQRRRLAVLQFSQKSLSSPPHLRININGSRVSDDHFNVQPGESFNYAENDKAGYTQANNSNEDRSEGLNLPDSPFSFRVDSGISGII